jgi:hypothetical protein
MLAGGRLGHAALRGKFPAATIGGLRTVCSAAQLHPAVGRKRVQVDKDSADPGGHKTAGQIGHEADILTTLLTSTPNLRAKFFANPTRGVGKSLPPAKSWDYSAPDWGWLPWKWYGSPFRYRKERAQLAKAVLNNVTKQVGDHKITASVNTDSVFEEYFAPIVKVSQRSFSSVYALSWLAFAAGLALIGVGTYVAVRPPAGTDSTVVSSVFGGSGAISALGAVYAMAKQGIREATLDHARVRVVLTAFATQLGQIRAIIEKPLDGTAAAPGSTQIAIDVATKLNESITDSMKEALNQIPSPVEKTAADHLPAVGGHSRKNGKAPTGSSK